MEGQNIQQKPKMPQNNHRPTSHLISQSPQKQNRWLIPTMVTMVLLLLGSNISLVYLYYQSKIDIDNQSNQISDQQTLTGDLLTQQVESALDTYRNEKYGYELSYSPAYLSHTQYTISSEKIELNGLDSLIIDIEPLHEKYSSAEEWWNSENWNFYHPKECYEKYTSSAINSLYDTNKEIISFDQEVVVYNNLGYPDFDSDTSDSICFEPGGNRIMILKNPAGKLLKIVYTASKASEDILTTFKFIEPTALQ